MPRNPCSKQTFADAASPAQTRWIRLTSRGVGGSIPSPPLATHVAERRTAWLLGSDAPMRTGPRKPRLSQRPRTRSWRTRALELADAEEFNAWRGEKGPERLRRLDGRPQVRQIRGDAHPGGSRRPDGARRLTTTTPSRASLTPSDALIAPDRWKEVLLRTLVLGSDPLRGPTRNVPAPPRPGLRATWGGAVGPPPLVDP